MKRKRKQIERKRTGKKQRIWRWYGEERQKDDRKWESEKKWDEWRTEATKEFSCTQGQLQKIWRQRPVWKKQSDAAVL